MLSQRELAAGLGEIKAGDFSHVLPVPVSGWDFKNHQNTRRFIDPLRGSCLVLLTVLGQCNKITPIPLQKQLRTIEHLVIDKQSFRASISIGGVNVMSSGIPWTCGQDVFTRMTYCNVRLTNTQKYTVQSKIQNWSETISTTISSCR